MNLGSSRGAGGPGLAGHWLKAKNERVVPLAPRFIAAGTTHAQVAALTAATAHATFKDPVTHFWFPPNPSDRKPTAAEKADLLARVEREFHLEDQPRVGVAHVLARDVAAAGVERHPSWEDEDSHEHYAYSLAGDSGRAVDHMRKSFVRQERVVVQWQVAHSFRITPMKHVTEVLRHLDAHDPAAAAAMRAAGFRGKGDPCPGPAHVAVYRSAERAQMERNPAVPAAGKTRHAFNARKDVLAAWKASDDGKSFQAALADRGYRLAVGSAAAIIVDPAGIEHRATEILATAGRKLDGRAIPAAEVHARLAGLEPPGLDGCRRATREAGGHYHVITGGQDAIISEESEHGRGHPGGIGRRREAGPPGGEGRPGDEPADLRNAGGGRELRRLAPTVGPAGGSFAGSAAPRPAHGGGGVAGAHRVEALRNRVVVGQLGAALGRPGIPESVSDLTARLRAGPGAAAAVSLHTIRQVSEDAPGGRRGRRAAWIAAQLRQHYDTGWLPASVSDRISEIRIDASSAAVILTLTTGTTLIDRLERIDVVGAVDDVAVTELVEAVRRRGWSAISVEGSPAFRLAVAWSMASADPPVEVADSPLTWEDLACIDNEKARRGAGVPGPVSRPGP